VHGGLRTPLPWNRNRVDAVLRGCHGVVGSVTLYICVLLTCVRCCSTDRHKTRGSLLGRGVYPFN
jgi:hypothetical protein